MRRSSARLLWDFGLALPERDDENRSTNTNLAANRETFLFEHACLAELKSGLPY